MNKNYWNECHIVFIHSFDKSLWGNSSSVILEEDRLLMEVAVSGGDKQPIGMSLGRKIKQERRTDCVGEGKRNWQDRLKLS